MYSQQLVSILLVIVLVVHSRIELELHDRSVPGCRVMFNYNLRDWETGRPSSGECFEGSKCHFCSPLSHVRLQELK